MNINQLMTKLWFRILVLSFVPLLVGLLFGAMFGGFGYVAAGWAGIITNGQMNKRFGKVS